MKRTLFIFSYLLATLTMSAQGSNTENDDYLPFVELGKNLHVVIVSSPNYLHSTGKYWMCKEEEHDGKKYVYTYLPYDEMALVEEVGLLREENRRVYKYDETTGRDIMLYDFSLKEGDTFTYEYGFDQPVNCKVLKQGWLTDGPKIVSSRTPVSADSIDVKYRWLHTWTIGRDNGSGEYDEVTTWVECIGALENMFNSFASDGTKYYLSYVERDYWENEYLPFSFNNIFDMFGQIHGCNLPIGASYHLEDWHHQLTYELEGDLLHVYGKAYTQCGQNNYAYFYERETDDPLVRKLDFVIQAVEPVATCMAHHDTYFSVSGFDPKMNYIVVDNQGVEHPVINKTPQMAYRPFVEDDKVWKVGYGSDNPIQFVEYYYFGGDTIIEGKTCKQMMCQRYVTPDYSDYEVIMRYPLLRSSGVWYEEEKKVYVYDNTNKKFQIMYDFSTDTYDTLQIAEYAPLYVLGPRQTGGIKGFKGVYRDVMISAEGEYHYNITWLEGVGSIEGTGYNVYYGKEYHGGAFLMSCTVGDEVIYFNDDFEDGATPDGVRKGRFDFTHTIKTKPKAPRKREKNDACISSFGREVARPKVKTSRKIGAEAASIYGEYNEKQLGIHLDALDDAYLVRISDETGKVVYEKAINAGSIVGLNIDISVYAKGRYTVTVENSKESFTGTFEAQTTSMMEVRNKNQEVNGTFDLQGRRVSSPKKGVYIRDGRKVVVK